MPPKKKNRDKVIGSDEVATDDKLHKFLEDVQKFTEKSKKINEKQKRSKKPFEDSKPACLKRGLFENGFKSKPFLKENKARLKSNLNDLVKECPKPDENEEENSSSQSQSTSEKSNDPGNQEVNDNINNNEDNNNNNNEIPNRNENATDEREKLGTSAEAPKKDSDSLKTIIKDKNQLKTLLWEKYCERMKRTESLAEIFPHEDLLKKARQKINNMIYLNFLQQARKFPSILKRIFTTDEIKILAQVVVNDKVDKAQQTDDVTIISDSICNNIQCEMSAKKDSVLSFPHSSQNICDNQKEAGNFFDLNPPKKVDIQVNFLESPENQPDIYSPGVQNSSPECNISPPPSPFPDEIRKCWAPSPLSTPQKPEIFSPTVSQIEPIFRIPSISPPEPLAINQMRNRRKNSSPLRFVGNLESLPDSPQLCFPKRKKFAYSPHRL